MSDIVNENSIRSAVYDRAQNTKVHVHEDWYTPTGNMRSSPMYETTLTNEYLQQHKSIKAKDIEELRLKASKQLEKWAEQEIRARILDETKDIKAKTKQECIEKTELAKETIDSLGKILLSTLQVDDRVDWDDLIDRTIYPPFLFDSEPQMSADPPPPVYPDKPFLAKIFPPARRKWEDHCQIMHQNYLQAVENNRQSHLIAMEDWKNRKDNAYKTYLTKETKYKANQEERNNRVYDFKKRFEQGENEAISEYLMQVFERSIYPDCLLLEYEVVYEESSKTAVVDVSLPDQDSIPSTIEYKFVAKDCTLKEVQMKKKDHDELYDTIVKQVVLRTIHEVFESVYTEYVEAVVVNGWVTYIDKSTGHDVTSCIISVSADRDEFESINLERVDPGECIKKLKGLTAGPLSNISPVKPILQLNTADSRFVESKEVLAELHSTTNLAEIPWEDFEHLVRDLFSKMFSGEGTEVRVTQASRDQGVDAIAFDPDPIRGGKFVIQAKRYTNVVGVSAVRDLYGTMISEGAVKGFLVTTAHYGKDSRSFVKDKPITLIDGSNLVYLLEQHGHKVRIDVEAARAKK